MNSLSFRCGVKIVNSIEVCPYVKFTCTNSQIKSSLENIGSEYRLQPELLEGEIEHSVNKESNFADFRHFWEPYFELDVRCLGFIYARDCLNCKI